jgi:hypothetical protein
MMLLLVLLSECGDEVPEDFQTDPESGEDADSADDQIQIVLDPSVKAL